MIFTETKSFTIQMNQEELDTLFDHLQNPQESNIPEELQALYKFLAAKSYSSPSTWN